MYNSVVLVYSQTVQLSTLIQNIFMIPKTNPALLAIIPYSPLPQALAITNRLSHYMDWADDLYIIK